MATQNFLVEVRGVWVLKRQVAADEGVEDNAAAPDVDLRTQVTLACYHFGRGVARRPACGLQGLTVFISVTQAEIDYFYELISREQQIFRFQISMDDVQLV